MVIIIIIIPTIIFEKVPPILPKNTPHADFIDSFMFLLLNNSTINAPM